MTNLQLLERVGQVEPIGPALLEGTLAELAEPDRTSPAPLRRPASDRRHVRWAAVAAASVVLAGTGTVLALSGTPGSPPPAGASELARLAVAANGQPPPDVPGPGQYLYTSSVEASTSSVLDGPHPYTVQLPEQRQIWIGADGSGRLVESFGSAIFLSPQDQANWVAAGSPSLATGPTDETFGPGGLSDGPTDLTTLPTDPKALAALISSRRIEGGPPGSAEDFTQIGDLLRETDAPPALRSALFEVAATLPGIEELGTVTDHSGRSGVGVAFVSGGVRHELIFNPNDASLMGEQDVVVDATASHEPVGTVADWAVYLASSVVDSDGASSSSSPAPPPASSGTNGPQPATGSGVAPPAQ